MNPATITKRPPKKPWGVLAAMTYLAVSLALGWIAAESFVSAALVDDKYVTVPQTESGRLVGVLRSMVWCTWAAGTLVFLLGIIWVALTRV